MYGLLKHENKMSVMNLKLKRVNTNSYSLPIQSKEMLVYHVGCRRFEAGAIYSQHTNGDKHKFERFMPTESTFVATIFAPITFPPASVLVYKKFEDGMTFKSTRITRLVFLKISPSTNLHDLNSQVAWF